MIKDYRYRRQNVGDILPGYVPNWAPLLATVPTVHTEAADITAIVSCEEAERPALDSYMESVGWLFVAEVP